MCVSDFKYSEYEDMVTDIGEVTLADTVYHRYEVVLSEYLVRVDTYRDGGSVRVLPGSVVFFDTVKIDWVSVLVEDGALRSRIADVVEGYLLESVEDK